MKVLAVADHFDRHPEEKLITVSRIKGASCPYRYFKDYVEQPKSEQAFISIENGIGSFFHSCAENRFREIIARDGIIRSDDGLDTPKVVRDFRLSFLWEGKLRAPYRIVRRGKSLDDFIRRLQTITDNFNAFLAQRLVGHQVVATEGALQIRTEEFYIRGKYDLITQAPGENFVLWDWKSGKRPGAEYHGDCLSQKIQLGIYAIWMRHYLEADDVKGVAVFLREGWQDMSETFTPKIETEVLDYLHDWRLRLNQLTSYPAMPNNLCDWCGWKPVCPAFTRKRTGLAPRGKRPSSADFPPQT